MLQMDDAYKWVPYKWAHCYKWPRRKPTKRTTVRRRGQPSAEEDNRPPKRTTDCRRGQPSAEEDNRPPKRTTVRRRGQPKIGRCQTDRGTPNSRPLEQTPNSRPLEQTPNNRPLEQHSDNG